MHQKGFLKEFTIVSRTIQHFVNRYSALIELKRYASRWTGTRRKISPIVCRKTSTLDTKRISGSHSTHLDAMNRNKEDENNEQETSEMQFEDFALKTNVLAFASRSKAKAKPRRRTPACLLIYKNCNYQ